MTRPSTDVAVRGQARRGHHPEIALFVIVACQLMLVLDASIVNVALPDIQRSLGFSAAGLSWVLTAYSLAFGGFLLLGGRAGDILGRRRLFIGGLILFTASSFLGGFATSSAWLLTARALQGLGAAAASPSALSLITTNFEEGSERTRAFSLYAAVSAGGASVGLIAGGMLTSWVSWRWVMFVNVPIGIAVVLLAPLFINESVRHPGRFDLLGALTSTVGVTAMVYGFVRASENGWGDGGTLVAFAAAAVLLVGFVLNEIRAEQPIMPLRLFSDRDRSAAYLTRLLLVAGMFGMFFFLTQFVQDVLGFSPLMAGFSFLPMTVALFMSARSVTKLLPKYGTKTLTIVGAAIATVGMVWLTFITTDSNYTVNLLAPMILVGIGLGAPFVTLTLVSLAGVAPADAGAASGLLNVVQQVGGSLGLAILVTVFGTSSRHAATHPLADPVAQAHRAMTNGIQSAFVVAAIFMAGTFLISLVAIKGKVAAQPAVASPQPAVAH